MAPGTPPEKYASLDEAHTEGKKLIDSANAEIVEAKTKRDLDILKAKISKHNEKAEQNITEAIATNGDRAKIKEVKATKVALETLKTKAEAEKQNKKNSVEDTAGVVLAPLARAGEIVQGKVLPTLNDVGEVFNSYIWKPFKGALSGISSTAKMPLIFLLDKVGWKSAADYLRKGTEKSPEATDFAKRFGTIKTNAATTGIELADLKIEGLSKEDAAKVIEKVATMEATINQLEKLGVAAPYQKIFEALLPAGALKKPATIDELQNASRPLLAEAQRNADPVVVAKKKLEKDNKDAFTKLKIDASGVNITINPEPDFTKEETKAKFELFDAKLKNITPPLPFKKIYGNLEPATAGAGTPKSVSLDQLIEAAGKSV